MHAFPATSASAGGERRRRHALLALGVLIAAAGAHFWYLLNDCPLDLSGDEAHYWEWSRRLDLSYYSKGPLVAYIIAASRGLLADWSQDLVGSEALAVRVPAIVLSVGTGLGIYTLAVQITGRSSLALGAVGLACTIPIFAVGAVLMTIDAPLAFLYSWALVAIYRGMDGRSTLPWLAAGALVALGILAKYTMLLLFPVVGLALLIEPKFRPVLRRPGPYLGTVLALLGFVPILLWNCRHNWVSFRHVAGQAGLTSQLNLNPLGPLAFAGGQAAVVNPVWLAAMVWALAALWRRSQPEPGEPHQAEGVRLLICATVVPWGVFLAFSFLTKIQPNWPMVALLPGTVLLVLWLARLLHQPRPRARKATKCLIAAGAILGAGSVAVVHRSEWILPAAAWLARHEPPWNLTPVAKFDPTARLRGWQELGAAVGRVIGALRACGRDPFIATDDYQTASEIAFYCPGQPTVYCLQAALGDRQSQYDLWRPNPICDPEHFWGRPCVYVGALKTELVGRDTMQRGTARGWERAETVEHRVGGHLIRVWPIYVHQQWAGLSPDAGRPQKF